MIHIALSIALTTDTLPQISRGSGPPPRTLHQVIRVGGNEGIVDAPLPQFLSHGYFLRLFESLQDGGLNAIQAGLTLCRHIRGATAHFYPSYRNEIFRCLLDC